MAHESRQQVEKSEARIYLENIEWMRKEIRKLTERNQEYQERKINIRGQDYSRERVRTSPDGDVMRIVDWYNDEIDKNNRTIFEYDRECKVAEERINSVSDERYSDILYYHYIRGYSLLEVSDILGKNYDHTRHLKGEALIAFQDEVIEKLKANGEKIWIYKREH